MIPVSIANGGGSVQFITTSSLSNFQIHQASNEQQQHQQHNNITAQQAQQHQDQPPPSLGNESPPTAHQTHDQHDSNLDTIDVPMSDSDPPNSPPQHSHNPPSSATELVNDISVPMATQAVEVATIHDQQQASPVT